MWGSVGGAAHRGFAPLRSPDVPGTPRKVSGARRGRKSAGFLPDDGGVSDAASSARGRAGTAAAGRGRRAWSDAPIRRKLIALVLAVAVWGAAAGLISAELGLGALGAMGLAAVVALVGEMLARRAIAEPIEDLVSATQRVSRPERPVSTGSLPRDRQDEIGQLARAIHQIARAARRDYHEASQLRRTLDDRVAKATRRATAQLSQMAMRDPLTGLGNRRFLEANGDELIQSCRLAGTDVIGIAADLDNFKQINDRLGHAEGDATLRFAGELIRTSMREGDYAIRTGGDEFVIFMPGCPIERVRELTDRVGKLYAERARTALPGLRGLGISFGVASMLRTGARSAQALIDIADSNLYEAKRLGKNQAAGA